MTGDVILVVFALTLLAAFAIGVRFPSWSWAAGPPAAILVAVLAILAFPETDPQRTALGESTQKEQFVFMLAGGGAFALILLAAAYALLAAAGVGVGRRRGAATHGPARSRPGDDASA